MESLFTRLYKYSFHSHNVNEAFENFLTEAFYGVLQSLSLESLSKIISEITNQDINFLQSPIIETQKYVIGSNLNARCFYDLYLKKDNELTIIIENKWDSPINILELEKYSSELNAENTITKLLILITKNFELKPPNILMIHHNWNSIYNFLNKLDKINNYILSEFIFFLKERGVVMEPVTGALIQGSKDINNLLKVIGKASSELRLKYENTGGGNSYTTQKIWNKNAVIYVNYFFGDSKVFFQTDIPFYPQLESIHNFFENQRYGFIFDVYENNFLLEPIDIQIGIMREFLKNNLMSKYNEVENSSKI